MIYHTVSKRLLGDQKKAESCMAAWNMQDGRIGKSPLTGTGWSRVVLDRWLSISLVKESSHRHDSPVTPSLGGLKQ